MLMFFWLLHLGFILVSSYLVRSSEVVLKIIVFIYAFYTLPFLIPFEGHNSFQLSYDYTLEVFPLFVLSVSDFIFIFFILIIKPVKLSVAQQSYIKSSEKIISTIAIIAACNYVFSNWDLFFLKKSEYLASSDIKKNLFFISIPVQFIMAGIIINNPFSSFFLRRLVYVLATFVVVLDVFMGHRLIALVVFLYVIFNFFPRLSVLIPVVLISVIGELSNVVKIVLHHLIVTEDFNLIAYLQYKLSQERGPIYSGEQAAILTNFMIYFDQVNYKDNLFELLRFFPFTNGFFEGHTYTTSHIGNIAGVGDGQGTAYSYLLFFSSTLTLGSVFVLLNMFLTMYLRSSILVVMSLNIFFSIMRNGPYYWAGQLKFLLFFSFFVLLLSFALSIYKARVPNNKLIKHV